MKKSTQENHEDFADPLAHLEELWNDESESFASNERIERRRRAKLPVSSHGSRGRPSRETRASTRVRHRISKTGGMHRRRRKQIR